jgi:catechol 2,3-dioxygenase-like lactoylglutathione lyase family enzyme
MAARNVNPIFRMFDEDKAREFYVGFLGMTVDWEHRFGDDFPLYVQVSNEWLELHLSEHHGDCSPGSKIRVKVSGIDAFHKELSEKKYKYNKPGIDETEWNTREVTVKDPFGNAIAFFEPKDS